MPVIGHSLCDHYIEGEPWAGTYCKLPAGHGGQHSAHYPEHFGRCLGCRAVGPGLCGGCGAYINDKWDGR